LTVDLAAYVMIRYALGHEMARRQPGAARAGAAETS
jgi:hypothetical protein